MMPPLQRRSPSLVEHDLIRAVRDARFAEQRRCPRCGCGQIIRWGTFSGRQRYRCGGCGRTFSDLTATPFAYTKRLASWPQFLHLFHDAATVRRCAAALHLQVSTAFRWRHATLDALRLQPMAVLNGIVELKELTYPVSFKGSRQRWGSGRRRGAKVLGAIPLGFPRTRVIVACDRVGAVRSENMNVYRVTPADVGEFLRKHVHGDGVIICGFRRGSPYGSAILLHGCRLLNPSVPVEPWLHVANATVRRHPLLHTANVEAYARRFDVWLERFRGIATRYLNNYLAWHALVDRSFGEGWISASLNRLTPRS